MTTKELNELEKLNNAAHLYAMEVAKRFGAWCIKNYSDLTENGVVDMDKVMEKFKQSQQ
jgi:hypothetical protein